MGTGTFATTVTTKHTGIIKSIVWTWTSHSGTGNVIADALADVNGIALALETNPGSPAPDDNYDITITNDNGIDILNGAGADRDTANSEIVAIPSVAAGTTPFGMPINGSLTFNVANAGNSKQGVAILHVLTG